MCYLFGLYILFRTRTEFVCWFNIIKCSFLSTRLGLDFFCMKGLHSRHFFVQKKMFLNIALVQYRTKLYLLHHLFPWESLSQCIPASLTQPRDSTQGQWNVLTILLSLPKIERICLLRQWWQTTSFKGQSNTRQRIQFVITHRRFIITFFTVTAINSRLCELRIDYLIEDGWGQQWRPESAETFMSGIGKWFRGF